MEGLVWYNLRSAFRQIKRLKIHTVISISGLVIGLSSVFVIAAWTIQELTFDKFHNSYDTIFMVTTDIKGFEGDYSSFPETPPPLAETLQSQIPEIEKSAHFIYLYGGRSLQIDHNTFKETGIAADPKFLELFNFELLIGDRKSLEEPNSILLTQNLADKLFPFQDAVGKRLTYNEEHELTVRGIMTDIPKNSSLQFDYVVPYQIESDNPDEWWQLSDATFIKTISPNDILDIKPIAEKLWREHITDEQYNINFIPLQNLRYHADFEFFDAEHGNIQKLYTFISVAALILLLACLNYINLNSSYASRRMNEVIVRKVNGASNSSLVGYFVSESVLISIISWGLSVLLSRPVLHIFQLILGVEIDLYYFYLSFAAGFFITILVVGIIAGLYPAILTSSVMPFNKNLLSTRNLLVQQRLKNVFLVSQFVLSITLVIVCLVIIRQNNFMAQFDVGYQNENIIEVGLYNEKTEVSHTSWKELTRQPEIIDVSFAGAAPVNLSPIFTTENWKWEGLSDGIHTSFYRINVDEDYLKVFQIPLVSGRFFNGTENDQNSIVINQKLQELLGFIDPVGITLRRGDNEYIIIGVVRNFHFQHLSNDIQPLLFMYSNSKNRMFVRTADETQTALAFIRNQHDKLNDSPFLYHYISDRYAEMYAPEHKISRGIIVFTLITIFLSSIGLFGMIVFNTALKTKEIAIRKVFGAKISEITIILNKGMLMWFIVAFVLSSGISWFVMNKWLGNYILRTKLDWWIFLTGAFVVLTLTLVTVSFQTWKAAMKNPVDALKYE